jgi:glycosyltransferase involved in cell wall biosynthesis
MTDEAVGPLSIAFLGDPNSVHLRRWAGWFAERGHRIALLVPGQAPVQPDLGEAVEIERFEAATGRLGLLTSGRSVGRALRRVAPDVLHVHHLTVNGIRAWLSGFHPYVVTVWGTDVLITARRSRRAALLARLSLRSADAVTGISRHVVDAAIERGARPERARCIHFGVDVERFTPGSPSEALLRRLGLSGRRVVFSPRAVTRLYRHDVVIGALASLPDDVSLVMTRYLADPAELARIEGMIEQRRLGRRVHIVPALAHSEMPDYYRLADAVVSVPESDAGPITLVEALACGSPTVSADLPPAREWLADLDPECLVPVGDEAATARALEAILARSPAERARFAGLGRARVMERADQGRTMAEMERIYRRLVAARRQAGRRGSRESL